MLPVLIYNLRLVRLRRSFMPVGGSADHEPFLMVHKGIHDSSHEDSGCNVKHGMLFDEHCRENDGYGKDAGCKLYHFPVLQGGDILAAHNSEVCTHGVEYMDARPEVRRCICLPEEGDEISEAVVARHRGET